MAEYIERDDALRKLEEINPVDYGAMSNYDAHHHVGECLRDCKEALEDIPAADVVPTSQERIYKDLLDALFEDVRNLDTTYSDACCMCSKGECDNCNLRTFEDELSAILGRAAERKKRLAD